MATRIVNGRRVDLTPQELAAIEASRPSAADQLAEWRASVTVSKIGLMRALKEAELWTTLVGMIGAASQDVQDEWNLATEIPRGDDTVAAFAAARSMTDAQVDALFRRAKQLA